jgi:hypothetical protein
MVYKIIASIIGAIVVLVAALGLAACSSGTTTGTQTISGSSTNLSSSTLPVTATGVVSTTGSLPLDTSSLSIVIKFAAGDLDLTHSKGTMPPPVVNTANCSASQVETGTYTVTGGTGKFSGATGHGDFKISFAGVFPKTSGACTITQSSTPVSGTMAFRASGPLTVNS